VDGSADLPEPSTAAPTTQLGCTEVDDAVDVIVNRHRHTVATSGGATATWARSALRLTV